MYLQFRVSGLSLVLGFIAITAAQIQPRHPRQLSFTFPGPRHPSQSQLSSSSGSGSSSGFSSLGSRGSQHSQTRSTIPVFVSSQALPSSTPSFSHSHFKPSAVASFRPPIHQVVQDDDDDFPTPPPRPMTRPPPPPSQRHVSQQQSHKFMPPKSQFHRGQMSQGNRFQMPPQEDELEQLEEEQKPDRLTELLQSSKFECKSKKSGYYADDTLGCQAFHYCNEGVKHSWMCPEGQLFHQVHMICTLDNGDAICQQSQKFHFVNEYLYKPLNKPTEPNGTIRYSDRYYPDNYVLGDPMDFDSEDPRYQMQFQPPRPKPSHHGQMVLPAVRPQMFQQSSSSGSFPRGAQRPSSGQTGMFFPQHAMSGKLTQSAFLQRQQLIKQQLQQQQQQQQQQRQRPASDFEEEEDSPEHLAKRTQQVQSFEDF